MLCFVIFTGTLPELLQSSLKLSPNRFFIYFCLAIVFEAFLWVFVCLRKDYFNPRHTAGFRYKLLVIEIFYRGFLAFALLIIMNYTNNNNTSLEMASTIALASFFTVIASVIRLRGLRLLRCGECTPNTCSANHISRVIILSSFQCALLPAVRRPVFGDGVCFSDNTFGFPSIIDLLLVSSPCTHCWS